MFLCFAPSAMAHNVSPENANFLRRVDGVELGLFMYLGAKHMVPVSIICCICSAYCFGCGVCATLWCSLVCLRWAIALP